MYVSYQPLFETLHVGEMNLVLGHSIPKFCAGQTDSQKRSIHAVVIYDSGTPPCGHPWKVDIHCNADTVCSPESILQILTCILNNPWNNDIPLIGILCMSGVPRVSTLEEFPCRYMQVTFYTHFLYSLHVGASELPSLFRSHYYRLCNTVSSQHAVITPLIGGQSLWIRVNNRRNKTGCPAHPGPLSVWPGNQVARPCCQSSPRFRGKSENIVWVPERMWNSSAGKNNGR